MKNLFNHLKHKVLALAAFLCVQTMVLAQDAKIEVRESDVSSWFARNWMWIAGVIVLLVLIILFSGGSSRTSRSTTTVSDNGNTVRRTTTTETEI